MIPALGAGGRGFDSPLAPFAEQAFLAQMVERWPFKPMVVGSIPTVGVKQKLSKLISESSSLISVHAMAKIALCVSLWAEPAADDAQRWSIIIIIIIVSDHHLCAMMLIEQYFWWTLTMMMIVADDVVDHEHGWLPA